MAQDDKRIALRNNFWPDAEAVIYDPKKTKDDGTVDERERVGGFSQIPRVVPMVASLANTLGGKVNAGGLLQALWSYDWGSGFLEVDSGELLLESGYASRGKRAERTWQERIQVLTELNLIRTKRRSNHEHGYVLLLDPYLAVFRLKLERTDEIDEAWWDHFTARCIKLSVPIESYEARAQALVEKGGE